MKKEELLSIIDSQIPKFYGFSYALLGDELEAEQVIIDAYTVFLMKEKDFLTEEEGDFEDKHYRQSIKKYLLREMTREIYELSIKRFSKFHKNQKNLLEYNCFFEMNMNKRALIYLKEVGLYTVKDLQEIFTLERHQVIELFYNAKFELLNESNKAINLESLS